MLIVPNFVTVNLSDFSRSAFIFAIKSLEIISLFESLFVWWGHAVQMCAAIAVFEFVTSGLDLASLPLFLLTLVVSESFVLCT